MRSRTRGLCAAGLLALSMVLLVGCKASKAWIIDTVAGTGTHGDTGDGGPATDAKLGTVLGLAFSPNGDLYLADDTRVRKIDAGGTISTVAGTLTAGYSGDGGPATAAQLGHLTGGLAFDADGNLYLADFGNKVVRKVDTNGVITTVAGNGTEGYSGDGGPAPAAALWDPKGVAVDGSGNLYIACGNGVVRKVDPSGTISTFAGSDAAGYSGDGGPATSAKLYSPEDVAVDADGNVYIAEGHRVRKVDTSGIITTFAGNAGYGFSGDGGPATSATLWVPSGLAFDAKGNLYIADTNAGAVRKVDTNGIISTYAGKGTSASYSGEGGLPTDATLLSPCDVAFDSAGNGYIADEVSYRVLRVSQQGGSINGTITDGGSGIAGATVELYASDDLGTPVATTTSDADGNYGFSVVPGTYELHIVAPSGYVSEWYDHAADSTGATVITVARNDELTIDVGLAAGS